MTRVLIWFTRPGLTYSLYKKTTFLFLPVVYVYVFVFMRWKFLRSKHCLFLRLLVLLLENQMKVIPPLFKAEFENLQSLISLFFYSSQCTPRTQVFTFWTLTQSALSDH